MRVIAISSQKGGSGKSTIAGHLAVAAAEGGAEKIGLVDTDPQGSLDAWAAERVNDWPLFSTATSQTLDSVLESMRKRGVRIAFVDTPPAITRAIEGVVHRSDMVIIPTRPSPHDLRAAGATVDLVEGIGKPLVFVVNGATPRARLTGEAAIALSQHGTVAPAVLHNRQDFAWSMIDGRTVLEASANGKSADEVANLWAYIGDRIKRLPVRAPIRAAVRERPNFGRGFGSVDRSLQGPSANIIPAE